jgi:predicted nucleic acid-binding protein
MTDRVFVDTNVLVYAHDRMAGRKHEIAKRRVEELWDLPTPPSLSIQVLQELYVNLVKKRISRQDAQETIADYLRWEVVINDGSLLLEGFRAQDRWQISFWDALIVAAAKRAGATVIWSEDLSAGQDYGGVTVVNPLLE